MTTNTAGLLLARTTVLVSLLALVSSSVACLDSDELLSPDTNSVAAGLDGEGSQGGAYIADGKADSLNGNDGQAMQPPISDHPVYTFPARNQSTIRYGVVEWTLHGTPTPYQALLPAYVGRDANGSAIVGGYWEDTGRWWVWTEVGNHPGILWVRDSTELEMYLMPEDEQFWAWQAAIAEDMLIDFQRHQAEMLEVSGEPATESFGECMDLLLTYFAASMSTTFWTAMAAVYLASGNPWAAMGAWGSALDAARRAENVATEWAENCP